MSPQRFAKLQIEALRLFNKSRHDGKAFPGLLSIVDALGLVTAALQSAEWAAADNTASATAGLEEVLAAAKELEDAVKSARSLLPSEFARNLDLASKALLNLIDLRRDPRRSEVLKLQQPRHKKRTNDNLVPRDILPCDSLTFGAGAPQSVSPGSHFSAKFIAYPVDQTEAAKALLNAGSLKGMADNSLAGIGSVSIAQGTVLRVALSGDGLSIEGAPKQFQTLQWLGSPALLTFEVMTSALHAGLSTILRFDVFLDRIQVGWVRLPLELRPTKGTPSSTRHNTFGHKLVRRAFASYASTDRQRVLDRVSAIRIAAGIEVFVDRVSLKPGERWQERLAKEIDTCDTFMLFWSGASQKSRWVRWEWERALDRRGIEIMQFHPLVNGIRPPTALKAIHLSDELMDLRKASVDIDDGPLRKGEA